MSRRRAIASSVDDNDNDNEEDDVNTFRAWANHSDLSFHKIDEDRANQIEQTLLIWYRKNRRKLPWRGDSPPYDGSTAGINSITKISKRKNNESVSTSNGDSKKITSFFKSNKKAKLSTSRPSMKNTNVKSEIKVENYTDFEVPSVSAYGVWVSEIMLQQTRVEAVIPFWIKWMLSFPTVYDLANATEDQVNAHWAGLGFYRRARLLHQGAKMVVTDYNGELPETVEGLLKIPGVGPYTASAIASIAYAVQVPVVDGNVCRVLSRLTGIANHIKAPALKDKWGWDLATQLVKNSKHPGELNQAIMELGATYCAPAGTGIDPRDPLKDFYKSTRIARGYQILLQRNKTEILSNLEVEEIICQCSVCADVGISTVLERLRQNVDSKMSADDARKEGNVIFPLDPPKAKRKEEDLAVAIISNIFEDETWWLLIRRPKTGLLAGQWEFPSICVESRQEGKKDPPTPKANKRSKALTNFLEVVVENADSELDLLAIGKRRTLNTKPLEHIFSHIKHLMWLEALSLEIDTKTLTWKTSAGSEVRWMREKDMIEVGITSGVKKILKTVKNQKKSSKKADTIKK